MEQIKKMTVEDLKKIGDILQTDYDDFWNFNILKEEIEKSSCKYIVAKNEYGDILGFAGIFINIDIIEIMNIVVKKSSRHQGIGSKLLEELINISKETKLKIINLEVNSKNTFAIELYKKFGFKNIRN